jgi:hypothetical protein
MFSSFIVFALAVLAGPPQSPSATRAQVAQEVRQHLASLPYYGVFDLITFTVDENSVVSLGGYVLTDTLKKEAEREAREVKGVHEVVNRIAVAPVLPVDDDIRHAVYHAIYGDAALSRYGTPTLQMPSMRPGFRAWGPGIGGWGFGRRGSAERGLASPRMLAAPFYGYDPIGTYAIHIIVKDRVVTLVGVVDSDGDKTIAGLKARGVGNVPVVNNDLQVAMTSSEAN